MMIRIRFRDFRKILGKVQKSLIEMMADRGYTDIIAKMEGRGKCVKNYSVS